MNQQTLHKSHVSRIVTKVLAKVIPDRTKRLVMLSSLYASMCNKTNFNSNTISKLNKIMALSSDDKALEFPMQLSSAIWHGDQGKTILHDSNAQQLSVHDVIEKILNTMPQWLIYSDRESVSQDIAKLLANRSKLEV